MGDVDSMLNMLQMCDSAFPTGGFSHSVGFEAAEKHGCILNKEMYFNFTIGILENTGTKLIPFVVEAYRSCDNINEIVKIDKMCQSCLSNHVENRASVKQGRSFTETSANAFYDKPAIRVLQTELAEGKLNGHFAVMYGVTCGLMGISLNNTLQMFMFNTLKTITAASVRLGHTGTMEAQKMQYEIQKYLGDIILRSKNIAVEDAHTSFPVIDIIENVHDTMFAKLFYS